MKKYILLFVAGSLLIACNDKKEASKSEEKISEQEVTAFIKHYDDLWTTRDTTGMRKAVAENYVYFSSTGNTATREQLISWFNPADRYKVDTSIRSEIHVTINGNVATVSSRWVGAGSFEGERFRDNQRCSLTIQKINGELKLISEHCTQIVNQ